MKTQNTMTGLALAVLLVFGLIAPAYSQTILIDFGNASSWRGVTTPSPDVNGHYWNSVHAGAYYPGLIDLDGNPTTVNFGFAPGGAGGTDSYNGPAGVVTSNPPTPTDIARTDIDAAALGNLGVKQAAMDFYTTSRFEIQGLDPTKTYNLTFFGSHKYSKDMTTVYSVYTDNTYSFVVASASLDVVASPDPSPSGADLHNRDTVVTISDLDPSASNILYVKFIGSNGNDGYLNCMQIEEAPGTKATKPSPQSGAMQVPVTTKLGWTKPVDYTPSKYVLKFYASTADPNWLDPNVVTVDPVVDLNLDTDPATVQANAPVTLDYSTKYYWKVFSYELGEPNEGPSWSFTTAPELYVNAGPNIITWLDGGGAVVDLNGSATCQCVFNRLWSVVSKPAGSTVFIASPASAVTWASLDTVGTYVLKLTAQDNSVPPIINEDTMEIQVFADACLAAKDNPAGYTRLPHDSNDDCKVNLADFAQFAADWLEDLSLTQNLEY